MFFVFFIVKKTIFRIVSEKFDFYFWCDIIKFSPKVEI